MLTPLPTLAAYRSDLARYPNRRHVTPHDGAWLVVARGVEELLDVDRAEQSAIARRLGDALTEALPADVGSVGDSLASVARVARCLADDRDLDRDPEFFGNVLRVAEEMEEAGALNLAYGMLGHLRAACERAGPRRHGEALAIQGRIARELGEHESAAEHFRQLLDSATAEGLHDAASRAAHGLGGLALVRGNIPEARERYEGAIRSAVLAGEADLEGRAHRGLLIVAIKEGNLDEALKHGWAAFERSSGSRASDAELIANLAALCRECGHNQASFAGYSLAILWADVPRVRLPALGGAVVAAARCGEAQHVETLAAHMEREIVGGAQPFEVTQALHDMACAFEVLGDARATDLAARAEVVAAAQQFFELEHKARELQDRVRASERPSKRAPLELSIPAMRVIDSMTALARENAAISALAGTKE